VYRNFFSPVSRIGFEVPIYPLWSPVGSLNFFAPTDSTRIYIPCVAGKTTIKRVLHPRRHKSLCCARPTQNRLHKLTKRQGAGTKFVLFCFCSRLLLLPRLAVTLLLLPASARFLVLDKAVLSLLRYALFRVEHVSFVPVQVKIGTFLFQRLKP